MDNWYEYRGLENGMSLFSFASFEILNFLRRFVRCAVIGQNFWKPRPLFLIWKVLLFGDLLALEVSTVGDLLTFGVVF